MASIYKSPKKREYNLAGLTLRRESPKNIEATLEKKLQIGWVRSLTSIK